MSQTKKLSPIQEFFKDKSIFITGGTGFMGKVLIEKLLYSCSDLKEIFLLMRPKKGKVPEARLEDMFKLPVFGRVKEEKPELLKKIIPIQGDVTFDGLGLSGESLQKLIDKTNIVFHCAATLRLEANLKDSVEMNLTGTKRVVELCRKMKNVESIVHLSTAFCYCDQEVLIEKVYDCPQDPEDLIRCAEWMDAKMLEKITPELLHPHPNTYTYTKRLAEILVEKHHPYLPICIVRPSIVSPSWAEPVPGWVDSLNGPIGLMVGGAKGVIRSMLCNGQYRSEVIPVDIAISGLIAIAHRTGTTVERPKNIPVYNMSIIESKKKPWQEVLENAKSIAYEYPFEAGLWYPDGSITTSQIVHTFNVILFHWLPAYFIDFLLLIFGQKRFMLRVQQKVSQGLEVLQYFTTRQWDFRSERFFSIFKDMTLEDQEIFSMDFEQIDEIEYMKRSILGGRQYCMKEPLSTLPKARMQMKIMYAVDRIFKLLMLGLFLWMIYRVTGASHLIDSYFMTDSLVSQRTN